MARLIGVVHLPPLPGSPRSHQGLDECLAWARRDARALLEGGADGVIIENFHDVPFFSDSVPSITVAAMTAICRELRADIPVEIGVNVLRNDASAALAIAVASGADFIRVNVHSGAMLTDQGIITGRAAETLRLRRALNAEHIRIFADVLVKHAVPLGSQSMERAVADAVERGLADAVIVTGTATGSAALPEDVRRAVAATSAPIYVGSGISDANVTDYVPPAAGVIVGSWLKVDGLVANPVDVARVRALRWRLSE
ncbi:MAG TPA: phosphorybosylanthranilate isomerase [Chloroflexi bacterium]|nr:phosphorybosylanthranilate isomerase [Chloroflexota bacterium]